MGRLYLSLLLSCALASCSPAAAPVDEKDYSTKIVGDWLGTVADVNETIAFRGDGQFVSEVRERGFISNTLGQGVTGTIRGRWTINGKSITLNIASAENERVSNRSTTSIIETFMPNELTVKSDRGDTSKFVRAL